MSGESKPLIEEYHNLGELKPGMSATPQIYWLRYRELYPEVDASAPEQKINEDNKR